MGCVRHFSFLVLSGAVNYLAEHPELKVLVDEDNKNVVYTKIWKMISRLFAIPIDTGYRTKKKVEAGVREEQLTAKEMQGIGAFVGTADIFLMH